MKSFDHQFRLFLVATEFFRTAGGIQFVNRLLLSVLADWARRTPSEISLFSYGDANPALPDSVPHSESFYWRSFNRNRYALARSIASRALTARPHVVLFTHVQLLPLAAALRWIAPEVRIGVLGHGIEVWDPLPSRDRIPLQQADSVVAPSSYTREKLIDVNGVPPSRCVVIPHSLAPSFNPHDSSGGSVKRTGTTLLSVSRLNRADLYKGVEQVLHTMPLILRRCPSARYIIVGDGNDRERLENIAARLGLGASVEFRGRLSNETLHRIYLEADLFVLPSKKEGFGIVFLEAMAYGLSVVAAAAAGALDVVEDGVTGLLVPPDDNEALSTAILSLLENPEKRIALGTTGPRVVREKFTFGHFSTRWQRWLASIAPEAVYLARHSAAFASPLRTSAQAAVAR